MDGLLATHRAHLERWRDAMNLVGPGDLDEHYADAHAALDLLAEAPPAGRWADLGTGAGFPGIVFAARFPGVALELVDSRRKRCVFLEHVVHAAGPAAEGIVVRCARIESLDAGEYDGVLARALAPPEEVLAHARRLLRPGGRALLLLGGEVRPPEIDGIAPLAVRDYAVAGRARRAALFGRTHG